MGTPAQLDAPAETFDGSVPFVALERQHAALRRELESAFRRVVDADSFSLGAEVAAVESAFGDYCGVAHCTGVSSGTAALTLAMVAAGVRRGDEVIVPAHTFIASALGVVHAGAVPVFCDVDAGTGLIDPASAAAAIGPRTAAILAVHLYGQVCDMARLRRLADRHGLALLEDAAQAHGARHPAGRAGSLGDAAAFSFYPSKNLGALGDGGAVCTPDAAIADRVRCLRNLGQRRKGHHELLGYNARLDGLQAAFLTAKLPHLDRWNAARRRSAQAYRRALPPGMQVVIEGSETPSVHHLFPVRTDKREQVRRRLSERGIQTGVHYSPAVHRQPPFTDAEISRTGLEQAERWADEVISLPMHAELRTAEVDRVIDACHTVLAEVSQ